MKFSLKKPQSEEFLEFEAELKDFQSKKVIYHKPEVWRLWLQVGDYRVNLHKIFKSPTKELFHPHPWPMNTVILNGTCEVGFGYGKTEPELASTCVFTRNSSYEMSDPKLWHYVAPLSEDILTIMVSGKPWESQTDFNVRPEKPQPELSEAEKNQLWGEITSALERKLR